MQILSLCLSACLLAGCAASTPSIKPAVAHCPAPVTLPDRALTDQEVERFWSRDRASLLDCAGRLAAVIK